MRAAELEDEINELREQIDDLMADLRKKEREQASIHDTARDIRAFLNHVQDLVAPAVANANVLALGVEQALKDYESTQVVGQAAPVQARFDPARRSLSDVVDFAAHGEEVFTQARSGGSAFDAQLTWREQERVRQAAIDEVERQRLEVSVEVPPLTDETRERLEATLQNAEDATQQASRQEIDDEQARSLLRQLERRYIDGDDDAYDPWGEWEEGAWQ